MSKAEENWDAMVLNFLREEKSDDPDCCEYDAEEIMQILDGTSLESTTAALKRLESQGLVREKPHRRFLSGWEAVGGRLVFDGNGC